jgi:hypothetical protein
MLIHNQHYKNVRRLWKELFMSALLNLEPRDAGLLHAEPDFGFQTPADDLHDRIRCAPSVCIIFRTEECTPTG